MTGDVTEYELILQLNQRHTIPDAVEAVPGLYVFRLPDAVNPSSPLRWRIGHHSGLSIADASRREGAMDGAALLATIADWTQDADTLRVNVSAGDLFAKLSYLDCVEPGRVTMDGDVSRNGTYTDADIEQAAAEFKADSYNALEILVAMTDTVPWMGLDTPEFNEAHDRIVTLADAA